MKKKIWIIVISVILILTLSAKVSLTEPNDFTWNLRSPSISVYFTGGREIEGFNERFREELSKAFPMMSIWGRGSLELLLYEHPKKPRSGLQRLMDSDTIFWVRPKNLKYLLDLEAEHPDLLPLSSSELKSYAFPLLYFSRNVQTGKIRGVIIANKVDTSLIKLLTEKALPLDIPLEYISSDFTWNLQDPLILTYLTVRPRVKGADERLWKGLTKILRMGICGRPSLVSMEEKDIQRLMESHTIFLIHPKNLKYLQDLEAKYPDLLPLSCSKLKAYPFPLFYFSRNAETGRVRGVIIADKVDSSLARLLTEDTLPLDIPVLLEYKNGQLKKK